MQHFETLIPPQWSTEWQKCPISQTSIWKWVRTPPWSCFFDFCIIGRPSESGQLNLISYTTYQIASPFDVFFHGPDSLVQRCFFILKPQTSAQINLVIGKDASHLGSLSVSWHYVFMFIRIASTASDTFPLICILRRWRCVCHQWFHCIHGGRSQTLRALVRCGTCNSSRRNHWKKECARSDPSVHAEELWIPSYTLLWSHTSRANANPVKRRQMMQCRVRDFRIAI